MDGAAILGLVTELVGLTLPVLPVVAVVLVSPPGGETPFGKAEGAAIETASGFLEVAVLEVCVLRSDTEDVEVRVELVATVVVCVDIESVVSVDLVSSVGGGP